MICLTESCYETVRVISHKTSLLWQLNPLPLLFIMHWLSLINLIFLRHWGEISSYIDKQTHYSWNAGWTSPRIKCPSCYINRSRVTRISAGLLKDWVIYMLMQHPRHILTANLCNIWVLQWTCQGINSQVNRPRRAFILASGNWQVWEYAICPALVAYLTAFLWKCLKAVQLLFGCGFADWYKRIKPTQVHAESGLMI